MGRLYHARDILTNTRNEVLGHVGGHHISLNLKCTLRPSTSFSISLKCNSNDPLLFHFKDKSLVLTEEKEVCYRGQSVTELAERPIAHLVTGDFGHHQTKLFQNFGGLRVF